MVVIKIITALIYTVIALIYTETRVALQWPIIGLNNTLVNTCTINLLNLQMRNMATMKD